MPGLPILGVGLMWFAGLDRLITGLPNQLDYFEFEPATSTLRGRRLPGDLDLLRARGKPMLVHDVTCSVGTTARPRASDVDALARVADAVSSPWVSTHLSIDTLPDGSGRAEAAGFLLPPAQTPAGVRQVARNIRALRKAVGREIVVETGVNYLRPDPSEMPDGEFFAAVAEEADCLLLCDLHNLWCNERNGRQTVREVLACVPADRVCEIHLAGGQERDGYLLDAHSGPIDPRLVDLAEEVMSGLPAVRAITYELMPDYAVAAGMTPDDLASQVEVLRRLWAARPDITSRPTCAPAVPVAVTTSRMEVAARPDPESDTDDRDIALLTEYEARLRARLRGPSDASADPGMAVYRDLIATMRLGNIVDAVPLTYRLLVLARGWDDADRLCADYLASTAPHAWAHQEARQFTTFLRDNAACPFVDDVAGFEFAARDAAITGAPITLEMSCDPASLLPALRAGRLPDTVGAGTYRVVVAP